MIAGGALELRRRASGARRTSRGVAAVETLVAVPILLLLGLAALQWALVFHARAAVQRAAIEGARAGSVDHASGEAVERGIARGLQPWLHGASDPHEHAANLERARAHVAFAKGEGWLRWRQLSPTRASFQDWAEPARDDAGEPVEGILEIPNDNLSARMNAMQPASGVAGYRGREPIGSASGQTLADANLLKIELTYGVPLNVPLVGRFAQWALRAWDGCGAVPARRLGAIDLGAPPASPITREWTCAFYGARDESGRAVPRLPVRVSATIRMQSAARTGGDPPAQAAAPGASLGPGDVDDPAEFEPIPVAQLVPRGATAAQDGSADRSPGFLRIGAERLLPVAGACTGA